jgi:molybdopterin-guanine dinucleotide biosynthesis protein A
VPTRDQVCLGILAGGRGLRLGGVDKAFAQFDGHSLLARTLAAMGSGYARTLVSYNGREPGAAALRVEVLPDLRPDFPGPLAGLEALLARTVQPWLLTVPVDLRALPAELPERMLAIWQGVVLRDGDGLQPLVALWPVASARAAVAAALAAGALAVHPLARQLGLAVLDLSPGRLGNLNTPADFE